MESNILNWKTFVSNADEWVINYCLICAYPPVSLSTTTTYFSLHQALEMYLKTYLIKNKDLNELDDLKSEGHNIKKLLTRCKKINEKFLSKHKIDLNLISREAYKDFELIKKMNRYQEFYFIASLGPDSKYLGTATETACNFHAHIRPNPIWAVLFCDIRKE